MPIGTSREGVRFRFGDFELSTNPAFLVRAGERVDLAPQPAKLLELLLASAGEVVTREAIRACLWEEGTFVDHSRGINFVVHQIRVALADHASEPRYVETVPRKGYRFIVPVSTRHASENETSGLAKATIRGLALAFLTVAAVVLLFGFLWRDLGAADTPRLAVLGGSDPGSQSVHHVAFVTEELIGHLIGAFGPRLDIVAPPPGVDATSESVVAEVGYVLSLAHVDGREAASMVLRLSRVHDHTALWTTSGPVSWQALPEICNRVVEGISEHLGIAPLRAASLVASFPQEALVSYFEGKYHLEHYEELRERAWPDKSILRTAQEALENALALAPDLERAQVALAEVMLRQRRVERARSLASAVLDANPASLDAHLVIAEIALYFERRFDAGLAATNAAMALDPGDPASLMLHAYLLSASGRHQEAMDAAHRAVDADMSTPKYFLGLAHVAMNAGAYEAALKAAEHALAFEPAHCDAWRSRIESQLLSGENAAALESINTYLATWESRPGPAASIRHYRQIELTHRHWSADGLADLPQRALVHIGLGEVSRAVTILLDACEEGVGGELAFLAVNPRFAAIRSLPTYPELEACVSTRR